MSAIILDSQVVHYEVLGRGRPVVFLHGWVGSWRYWVPTMQAVSIGYRAYSIDLWGFGDSAKASSKYALAQQVGLVDDFLNEMGIAKVVLIGHGLGAVIAMLYAQKHTLIVDRLMLIGYPFSPDALDARLQAETPTALARLLLPQSEADHTEAAKADHQAVQISLESIAALDLSALPKQLKTPCLLVHGENDSLVQVPTMGINGELPGNLHTLRLEGAGHFPMVDESNKFNRLLADFLALETGQSPQRLQLKEEWKRRVR